MEWNQVQDVWKKMGTDIHAKFKPRIPLLISRREKLFLRSSELPFCRFYLAYLGLRGAKLGLACD